MTNVCATDGPCLHGWALWLFSKPFVRGWSVEGSVWPVEVVVVLPLLQPVVEQFGVVDDDSVEHPVGLFLVDPM